MIARDLTVHQQKAIVNLSYGGNHAVLSDSSRHGSCRRLISPETQLSVTAVGQTIPESKIHSSCNETDRIHSVAMASL